MRPKRVARRLPKPTQLAVKIKLPLVGEISGTWAPQDAETKAAWELYVELVTRVAVVELGPSDGLMREALSSLYTLFETTRVILKKYGTAVAPRHREGDLTFGKIAVTVLNRALRPLLSKWHPALMAWEATAEPGANRVDHERRWERAAELRSTLDATRATLADLAEILADVAGAAHLVDMSPVETPSKRSAGGGA